jgi:hypothetical protein
MLREFKNVKQEPGSGRRRWFESDHFDLVVWLNEQDGIDGFQICYDLGLGEHALTWRKTAGFAHNAIDSGERVSFHPCTPILVADGKVPWREVINLFDLQGGSLEPALREFVHEKLIRRK